MSTKDGAFVLRIPHSTGSGNSQHRPMWIVASMVGYRTDSVSVQDPEHFVHIPLAERAGQSRDIVVIAEDPSLSIMRAVLARKQQQKDSLNKYTYMLYTKLVVTTDTLTAMRNTGRGDSTVFSIMETFSKGYVQQPDAHFNEIIQKRQTSNIPPQANFVAFGTNLNLFDDELEILGERIFTPFHEDAIDFYDYTLLSDADDSIAVISVQPTSALRKAFTGKLYIDKVHSVPLEARLIPTKAVNLPFDARLTVRQTFTVTNNIVVPQALAMQATVQADILFILSPRLDIDLETFCYDYNMQEVFPPDVFDRRRVESSPYASVYDSAFWFTNQKLPLRPEEEFAYREIESFREFPDSSESGFLTGIFRPVAWLANTLARNPFSGFQDVFRNNRIHGPYLGIGLWFRPDTVLDVRARCGYGISDNRWYGYLGTTYFPEHQQRWFIGAEAYSHLDRRDNTTFIKTGLITLTSLLFGNDYGDYYYSNGWGVNVGYGWGQLVFIPGGRFVRPSTVRMYLKSEYHLSAASRESFSLFGGTEIRRENPAIFDGMYSTIGLEGMFSFRPERRVSRHGALVQLEHSIPGVMRSDAAFTRLECFAFTRLTTFPSWTLDVTASLGYSMGSVPPQKFFSLESAVSGIAVPNVFRVMQVKEFYGDRYATIGLSHNFGEIIPGLLRIPNVAAFGIEFITFGNIGWTTFSAATRDFTKTTLPTTDVTQERVYYEVGLGVNRILFFFRFDVTSRISQRQEPQFRFTLSGATF